MFRGRYEHTIDKKGRISIPSKYREILIQKYDETLIITNNYDSCLVAFPKEEWELLEKKVAKLPQMKPEVRAFQRYFISGAVECPVDKQGRILIPQSLRDYAKITKDVILVGLTKKFEIWAKDKWEPEFDKSRETFENSGDTLGDLGI
jgi:MraZ protein